MAAVAQHGDAVGDQQRLLERVRDEDDGDAALLEIAHQVEEVFLLLGRQAGRRLVEDDHLGVVQHGARDLDHLLLGGAELRHRGCRRHVEIERLQELLGGDVDAAQAIVEFLLPQEEVLRHRHRRHQAVLLEDHGDAELAGFERRARHDLAAARSASLPSVSDTTPAMTLVRVDLPAPFSPTSAWISPSARLKSTPSIAGTPPYELRRLAQFEDRRGHAAMSLSMSASGEPDAAGPVPWPADRGSPRPRPRRRCRG